MRRRFPGKILLYLILVTAIFSSTTGFFYGQETAETWLERGRQYRKEGLAGLAAKAYSNVIRLDPKNVEAYYARGRAFIHLDLKDRAMADFNKTIQLDGTFADGYYWRGAIYSTRGKSNKAIKEFTKAIRYNDKNPQAYMARGNTYKEMEKYKTAIQDFDRMIALAPESHLGYMLRGHSYQRLKLYPKAIEDYLKVIRIKPKNLTALNNIADAYMKSGKPGLGLHYLATALKVKPGHPTLYMTLGEIFEKQQRFSDALEAYRHCKDLAEKKIDNKALIKKAVKKIDALEGRLNKD
jgi:tetratricopeptide (TPR) repeat protein